MARSRIPDADGDAAVAAALAGGDRTALATAVRYLLQLLAERHPGGSVEVRVPPFGAVQCVEGPKHTRGTPPNVVEMDPAVWLAVATGERPWADAREAGEVRASGSRADLTGRVPVWRAPVRR
ncbi:sterol carrier family protein [Amnibacterium sp. CER49]|uniref:sterol carrier family protein n=1 Tax=Amnibacterium sp. CER49 TaxID=3039161 RepID=UPI0024493107|nr:sterol carrier family protein [Amnibacterium sp. CER49]MDH2443733.1 sterol carrier family protein [Amnibacterium sp. CER49]